MPLLVLYGSNTGTCETIAHRIGEDATVRGFSATVAELDAYAGKLPTEGAVVIATASYNGTPPDNAAKFVEWLSGASLASKALAGVRYTVFGCGDHDWADTFQRIPRLIDAKLEEHGAEPIYPRAEGDQSDDIDSQFRNWATVCSVRSRKRSTSPRSILMRRREDPATRSRFSKARRRWAHL